MIQSVGCMTPFGTVFLPEWFIISAKRLLFVKKNVQPLREISLLLSEISEQNTLLMPTGSLWGGVSGYYKNTRICAKRSPLSAELLTNGGAKAEQVLLRLPSLRDTIH